MTECNLALLASEALKAVDKLVDGDDVTAAERLFEIEDLATRLTAKSHEGVVFQLGLIASAVDDICARFPEGHEGREDVQRPKEAVERMVLSVARFIQEAPAPTDELFRYYLSVDPYTPAH